MGCCRRKRKVADVENPTTDKAATKTPSKRKCCLRRLFKTKSRKKNENSNTDRPGNDQGEKKRNFPCCFAIPLDIAMEGLAFLDIIYYTLFAIVTTVLVTLDPFAGRHKASRIKSIGLQNRNDLEELLHEQAVTNPDDALDYPDRFAESTTRLNILGTGLDLYLEEDSDSEKYSRTYSRVAFLFQQFGQEVDDGCGRSYYKDFLFAQQLIITRQLFAESKCKTWFPTERLATEIIEACVMYIFIAISLLICICCFRGHRLSKLLVIALCYAQLAPSYLILGLLVRSQSQRLCILQHGLGPYFKGQTVLLWVLLWPLISFKPYEIFIWSNYISRYFQNKDGVLLDESYFSASKTEERQRKRSTYYRTLYAEEYQHHPHYHKNVLFKHQNPTLLIQQPDGKQETQVKEDADGSSSD